MKNQSIFPIIVFLFTILSFTACKKDEATVSNPGDIEINIENVAGTTPLTFGTSYVTENKDTVVFTAFNYFLSNFTVIKTDGTEYTLPKDSCYFLVRGSDAASQKLLLKNIPAGQYNAVRFTIGVDSTKSVSDISQRTGVLDPAAGAAGMYWSWNSGYIFVRIDGTSPQAPLNTMTNERTIQYHTGLFGGQSAPTLNNLRQVTLTGATGYANVKEGKTPEIHVFADILEVFKSPNVLKVAETPTSHAGPYSAKIAENYADMFKLDHFHN